MQLSPREGSVSRLCTRAARPAEARQHQQRPHSVACCRPACRPVQSSSEVTRQHKGIVKKSSRCPHRPPLPPPPQLFSQETSGLGIPSGPPSSGLLVVTSKSARLHAGLCPPLPSLVVLVTETRPEAQAQAPACGAEAPPQPASLGPPGPLCRPRMPPPRGSSRSATSDGLELCGHIQGRSFPHQDCHL